jgi:hypothetical protein
MTCIVNGLIEISFKFPSFHLFFYFLWSSWRYTIYWYFQYKQILVYLRILLYLRHNEPVDVACHFSPESPRNLKDPFQSDLAIDLGFWWTEHFKLLFKINRITQNNDGFLQSATTKFRIFASNLSNLYSWVGRW